MVEVACRQGWKYLIFFFTLTKSCDQDVSTKVTHLSGWEIIMFIFCC